MFLSDHLFTGSPIMYWMNPGAEKTQRHLNEVKEENLITWNIDWRQMGVGGDTTWSLRAVTHPQYLILPGIYDFTFRVLPVKM